MIVVDTSGNKISCIYSCADRSRSRLESAHRRVQAQMEVHPRLVDSVSGRSTI